MKKQSEAEIEAREEEERKQRNLRKIQASGGAMGMGGMFGGINPLDARNKLKRSATVSGPPPGFNPMAAMNSELQNKLKSRQSPETKEPTKPSEKPTPNPMMGIGSSPNFLSQLKSRQTKSDGNEPGQTEPNAAPGPSMADLRKGLRSRGATVSIKPKPAEPQAEPEFLRKLRERKAASEGKS